MNLVVVGAHCGDAEIQAGAIAHKYAKAGHEVTFVHLTAGEKGNPAEISVEDYREQKIRESEKVAEILGVKTITLDYKDAELTVNDEIHHSCCYIDAKAKTECCYHTLGK